MPKFIFALLFITTLARLILSWSLTHYGLEVQFSGVAYTVLDALTLPLDVGLIVAITRYQARKKVTLRSSIVFDERLVQFFGLQLISDFVLWLLPLSRSLSSWPPAVIIFMAILFFLMVPVNAYFTFRLYFVRYYIAGSVKNPFMNGFKATKGRLLEIFKAQSYFFLIGLVGILPFLLLTQHFFEDKKDPIYWILTSCLYLFLLPSGAAFHYASAEISQALRQRKR